MSSVRSKEIKSSELVLLPQIQPGICNQVWIDFLSDRARFIRRGFSDISRENPELLEIIIPEAMVSPQRDFAVDQVLTYYELYSRSAQKLGVPMLRVSNELIMGYIQERTNLAEKIGDTKEGAIRYFEARNARAERRAAVELELSPEFAKFHVVEVILKAGLARVGINPIDVFELVDEVGNLMVGQHESNQLKLTLS